MFKKKKKYNYNDKEYKKWRDFIYRRDNYTCQLCGAKGNINAHHILRKYDYPSLVYEKTNGITLCKKCHYAVTGSEYYIAELFDAITHHELTLAVIEKSFNFIKKYDKKLYKYIQKNIKKISERLAITIKRQKAIHEKKRLHSKSL